MGRLGDGESMDLSILASGENGLDKNPVCECESAS